MQFHKGDCRRILSLNTFAAIVVMGPVLSHPLFAQARRQDQPPAPVVDTVANQKINLQFQAVSRRGRRIRLIGGLADPKFAESIGLSKEQGEILVDLDQVTREALYRIDLAQVKAYDEAADARKRYLERLHRTRQAVLDAAVHLALGGILTEPQAAYVRQSEWRAAGVHALADNHLAEILSLTKVQRREVAKRLDEKLQANTSRIPLRIAATQDKLAQGGLTPEGDELRQQLRIAACSDEDRIIEVLNPRQQQKWARILNQDLLPKRSPVKKTENRLTPAQERRRDAMKEDSEGTRKSAPSEVFRALSERGKALGLSEAQRDELAMLDKITRWGLVQSTSRLANDPSGTDAQWQKRIDHATELRQDFVRAADLVALLGVLEESQFKASRLAEPEGSREP